MAEPNYGMNIAITGDCSSFVAATKNAKAAASELDGMRAGVAIALTGRAEAVSGLGQVAEAAGKVPSAVPVNVDASGIGAARGELGGLRKDAQSLGRDLDGALGGSRVVSFGDGGSLRALTGDLSGATRGYSEFGSSAASSLQRADRGMQDVTRSASALNAEMSQTGLASAGALQPMEQLAATSVALADGGRLATDASRSMQSALGGVGRQAGLTASQVSSVTSALNSGSLVQGLNAYHSALSSNGVPPPGGFPPIGGGGGGGGAGGGGWGPFEAGGALDSGIKKLGLPAVAGAAIGVVEAVAPAAVGLLAMNEVVKDTPALAYASGKAMAQLADGIREGSQGATADGVPAFQALGAALRPLGEEVGHIGAANIGQILGAETSLAGGLTNALKAIEPTISPSISAVENLGNAFLAGVASPEVAKGITATANALSTPQAAQAVETLTSAVLTGSSYLAQGGIQAVTSILGGGNGATNVGTGWATQPVGETVAEHSGGFLAYDPATDRGQAASAPLPGGDAGVGWNQNTTTGRYATAIGSTLHVAGLAARDFMTGSMMRGTAAPELHAAGDDMSARWDTAMSGQAPPGSAGIPASADTLASSQSAAPHGWDQDARGNLTPSTSPGGGGGFYAGAPVGRRPQDMPGGLPASSPGATGGFGNGAPTGNALAQLNAGLSQTQPAASSFTAGLQQVGQSAQSVQSPLSQVQSHTQQAGSAVQQLAQQTPSALQQLAQIAPAVQSSLSDAGTQIQSSGQAMGQQIPSSMGDGITQNQQVACQAANKMGTEAANCGAAALQTASPSKVFVSIGRSIPDGLAVGVEAATPAALAAVQASMGKVVATGQAGLQTASPSKTFQSMGTQAMNDLAGGVNEGQQRQSALISQTAANMPQSLMEKAQKDAEEQQKQLEKANSSEARGDKAYGDFLDKMGYSQATKDRLMKEHQDKEKLDDSKGLTPGQKLRQGADGRENKNALDAMERAGIGGLSPNGKDPNGNPLTPHQQARLNTLAGARSRHEAALFGAQHGMSPSEAAQHLRGQAGGDASWAGAGKRNAGLGGMGDGIAGSSKSTVGRAGEATTQVTEEIKKKAGTHSPSTITDQVGRDLMAGLSNGVNAGGDAAMASIGDVMSGALGSGVTAASNGVMGIASNAGLAVGYQWARSMVGGVDSVLKTADYQSISLPQIGNDLAKKALGVAGLLGPAGSGGSIPNSQAVTMGSGTPAVIPAPVVNNYLSLDGAPIRAITRTEIDSAFGDFADLIPQQRG